MNTIQIQNYLSTLPVQNFGVYAADLLPRHISPSTAIIVNTDPHNEAGAHWVAFYLGDRNTIEYFDSYGQPPHSHFYQGFLRRNARRYLYNEHRLQDDNSQVCGYYCLVYLYYRSNTQLDMKMTDFVQLFGSSTKQNDALIKKMFVNIFHKSL